MVSTRRITDKQRAVIDTIRMHLTRQKAVLYLTDVGYPMSERTWYRWVTKLNNQKRERLYEIAKYGYEDEHTDSIEEIDTARKLLWEEYHKAVRPTERAIILEKIINTRPLLSSYYDSTQGVIEWKGEKPVTKENPDIQESEQQPNQWV